MPDYLQAVVASPWVLVAVFAVAALDAILPFAPSETTVIAVGVGAAASGRPNVVLLIAVAATGAYAGDRLSYLIGRRANGAVLARLGRGRYGRVARDWAHRTMHRRGGLLIVFARYLPGGRSTTAITAGVVGYPVARFRWYTLLAVTLWATFAALLGYLGGAVFASNPLAGLLVAWAVAGLVMVAAAVLGSTAGREAGLGH
jgi:membrane-associated protein